MKDVVVFPAMMIAFATAVTAVVTIAWGLATRPPRWRAVVALAVPIAAPVFAWRERMRARAIVAVVAAVAYAGLRALG